MKKTSLKMLALLLGISLSAFTLTSCDKDDDKGNAPAIVAFSIAGDNESATLAFDMPVFATDAKSGNLEKSDFILTLSGGTATLAEFTVSHTAGTNQVVFGLAINGIADGNEVITVAPASATSIYSEKGAATEVTVTKTANLNDIGIIGMWQSSGANVAPLLVYAGIDSIYAYFKADNSYVVESFTPDGSKTTLTGTFTQQRTSVPGIWDITVNQSTPTSLVSVGIFQVNAGNPLTMKYEVAQTEPVIVGVTPPTASAGFGSTSGGAYGAMNVQNYVKIRYLLPV